MLSKMVFHLYEKNKLNGMFFYCRAEAEQLAAIYQLLRNQEDKFQVGSMRELEDQLRLYRH